MTTYCNKLQLFIVHQTSEPTDILKHFDFFHAGGEVLPLNQRINFKKPFELWPHS